MSHENQNGDIGTSRQFIDTDDFSATLRRKGINLSEQRLLIANLIGTQQQEDLSEPPNCKGFGRIRHFSRITKSGWPLNPLPIDPATKKLGLGVSNKLRAQVFQNAICNWRCWYCYVPFQLLSANMKHADWLTASQLVDLYLDQRDPPSIIDLSGGQPDLIPEWIPWMIDELNTRGLGDQVYLWSDDNLSNDYFWKYLSETDRNEMAKKRNYGRVCCFKGFDADSFSFNTCAAPGLFDRQFELMKRLLTTGIDLYGYITLTTPKPDRIFDHVREFFDKIQALHENLPLRIVPLEVQEFTPVTQRLDEGKKMAFKNQWIAVERWQREIEDRFTPEQRNLNIADVNISTNR